jgi:hypothetical protein
MCPTMDAATEQLIREMWADLAAANRRTNAEIAAMRAEMNQFDVRLGRVEGLMFVIQRNFETIDQRLKAIEAR